MLHSSDLRLTGKTIVSKHLVLATMQLIFRVTSVYHYSCVVLGKHSHESAHLRRFKFPCVFCTGCCSFAFQQLDFVHGIEFNIGFEFASPSLLSTLSCCVLNSRFNRPCQAIIVKRLMGTGTKALRRMKGSRGRSCRVSPE